MEKAFYFENDCGALHRCAFAGIDNEGRASKRFLSLPYTKIRLDPCTILVDIAVQRPDNGETFVQTLLIDVIKSDRAVLKGGGTHDITQHISRKDGAAGTHKRNLFLHDDSPFILYSGILPRSGPAL